jgi:hypothetical protein
VLYFGLSLSFNSQSLKQLVPFRGAYFVGIGLLPVKIDVMRLFLFLFLVVCHFTWIENELLLSKA